MLAPGARVLARAWWGHRGPGSFHNPVGLPDSESLSLWDGWLPVSPSGTHTSWEKLVHKLQETGGVPWCLTATNLRLPTHWLINSPILFNPWVFTFDTFCPLFPFLLHWKVSKAFFFVFRSRGGWKVGGREARISCSLSQQWPNLLNLPCVCPSVSHQLLNASKRRNPY